MSYNGLTNQGLEYLTRCQVESKPVVFSKVKIGNGNIPMGSTGETTTDLYSFKKEIEILSKEQVENSIKMEILINNFDVLEEFYVKEIGVYVMDNDVEKLYWYINKDRPSPLPDKNTPAKHKYILHLETSQMESIILNYTGADLLVDKEFVEEKLNEVKDRTKALQFSDIESMKQKNLKVGDIVEVLGYYEAGDGAGHKRIISNTDDGSGVQLNNGLWANIVHNGEINIKWLGAKGDGVTDDTNSFKTQFNLFIPVGTFLINNTIKMQSGNHLRGENMYDSIIKVGSDVDGIWVNTDCTLENLAFDSDLEIYNSDVLRIGDEAFTQMPKNGSMCGVNVNNISSNFKCSQGNSNLFHILSSGYNENGNLFLPKTEGYWGLKINHIRYKGYFNRVFKIESKIWNKTVAPPWLTYSSVSDVKGIYAITGIEGVATFETGNYETSKITPAINIKFENCNFESGKKTEYGIISDGIQLDLYEVVFGDFQDGLPGHKIYKINYYSKLFNYGTFIVYDNFFDNKDLENKYFDIANFYGDIQDFIFGHINIKVKNISTKNNVSIDKNSLISSMNEYNMVKKNLLWICRYNKNNILNISSKSNSYINFSLNYLGIKDSVFTDMYKANFVYNINFPETAMQVLINSPKVPEFVYEENENFLNIGIVYKPEDKNSILPINSFFSLGSMPNLNLRLLYLSTAIEIEEEYYLTLKKCKITQTLEQLSTTHMAEKMKQENVYNDYITYMDEKDIYNKKQKQLEEQIQLAYKQALQENQNLSYEEFMSFQPMTLNLVEEPQPSQALKQFIEKYL